VSADFHAAIASLLDAIASSGKPIKLDCAKMDYIDSAGIGLLVMAYKKAQKLGIKIILINVKASTKEILFLANVQKLIEIQ